MGKLEAKLPPFGMQCAGGAKNRPALSYPEGKMAWPPLDKNWKMQVCLENGILNDKVSLSDGVSGAVCPGRADSVKITSDQGHENGLMLDGGKYVLESAEIHMSGDAKNDFNCDGTGVTALGHSSLTILNSVIETEGLVKSCTIATEGSILKVYNSKLSAAGGTLPEDYDPKPGPGGMLTPPPGLEIGGTARAHLSMDNSESYFYNCTIEAQGWAALSTDASNGYVYLEANDCDITVKSPGYGIYSDGGCHVAMKNCRVNTATHTGIMAGECSGLFENVKAKSGRYFLMAHNVMGTTEEVAEITVLAGDISTEQECFYLKSCNTYIDMQGTSLKSAEGILVHAIENPDMCATKVEGKEVYGNNIVMTDMDLSGDIVNDDGDRTLKLTLSGTRLDGALKDVYLTMDQSSRWLATGDSTVAFVGDIPEEAMDGAAGVTIRAYALDGCELASKDLPSGGRLEVIH